MTAVPRKEVTTRQVFSIRFGVFTDDEVLKISVKRLTSPITYDNFNNVVPDGLYDPALGPVDYNGRCTTCGLGHAQCPGHFGHIQLPVPVYNPLLFSTMYRLLRHTCVHCHNFKMGRNEMAKFLTKFECLSRGDLVGASSISMSSSLKGKSAAAFGLGDDDDDNRKGSFAGKVGLEQGFASSKAQLPQTCHVQEATRSAVAEFFARMPTTKCANCGAHTPVIKKQGASKVFQQYTRKAVLANWMRGIKDAAVVAQQQQGRLDAAAAAEGGGGGGGGLGLQPVAAAALGAGQKRKRGQAGAGGEDKEVKQGDKKGTPAAAAAGVAKKEEQGVDVKEDIMVWRDPSKKEEMLEEEDERPIKRGPAAKGKKHTPAVPAVAIDESMLNRYVTPTEAERHLRLLCAKEGPILAHLYGCRLGPLPPPVTASSGLKAKEGLEEGGYRRLEDPSQLYRIFFIRVLAVAPNKFRPPSVLGDQKYEHTQNVTMQRIINAALSLQSSQDLLQGTAAAGEGGSGSSQQQQQQGIVLTGEARAAEHTRFLNAWLRLQNEVNALIDSTTAENTDQAGIRQQLEKKEGLFRKNMMGKRVNFAARSVISPDPYIGTGEIGVPPYFATRLSFPEPVTPWNIAKLRQMVINGPEVHPGAVAVEDENGSMVQLARHTRQQREGLAKRLLTAGPLMPSRAGGVARGAAGRPPLGSGRGGPSRGKVVYRHLVDGDIMLTNRQPTLHKPGLMAHKARVLKGERTIRMHYANCSTFNADFDGDEINLHLPQDQYGRAEGYGIVHADQQFIVPTDGKPIRGLIQDHVVGGVMLTQRDCFLTKAQYTQLLYNACRRWSAGVSVDLDVVLPPPALIKPRQLWTGKQLLSSLVAYYTRGQPPLTLESSCKVPVDYWGRNSDEGKFVFHKGELVAGCLDKAQFGKYGLVHAVQELYGNSVAGELLSALSRLFTLYLQWHGFTCGMDDLLLVGASEEKRANILNRVECTALSASAALAGVQVPMAGAVADGTVPPYRVMYQGFCLERLAAERKKVAEMLGRRYRTDREAAGAQHDMKVTGVMHPLSSEVLKACLPVGQAKPFPANCMSLMTVSGAKGSQVNFSQIACLLGQQELEGRRVPRMASGKTLPCFRAFDGGARSGGFVGDRFLTGLRPQEYYFHCMAGREGLVDTAVKTSRSGYLQRCLVKNLEALKVAYDNTVRDSSDGSVVQFYYGEDGLDVTQVSYLRNYDFLARNAAAAALKVGLNPSTGSNSSSSKTMLEQAVMTALRERARLLKKARKGDLEAQQQLKEQLPIMARFFPSIAGVTSEAFEDKLWGYCTENKEKLLWVGEEGGSGSGKKRKKDGEQQQQRRGAPQGLVPVEEFKRLMELKYMQALAAPGEAVGVLAAQSVGEPSTQMTLNTFHMAGRGEANVTLGIPRLREILMTAAPRIKTPTMTISLREGLAAADAQKLASRMRKLRLAECLRGLRVKEQPVVAITSGMGRDGNKYGRRYTIQLKFYRQNQYPKEAELTWAKLAAVFSKSFCPELEAAIAKAVRRAGGPSIGVVSGSRAKDTKGGTGDEGDEGGEPASNNRAAAKRAKDDGPPEDYEEDEELREGKLRFRGGREEAATYEAPDEEDADIAAAMDVEMRKRQGAEEEDEEVEAVPKQPAKKGAKKAGTAAAAVAAVAAIAGIKGKAAAGAAGGGGRKGAAAAAGSRAKQQPAAAAAKKLDGGDREINIMEDKCTCEYKIVLPLSNPKLLMLELAEAVAAQVVVSSVPGIEKVHVLDPEKNSTAPRLQTEGINFKGVWQQSELAEVNTISCNDVHAMLVTYGVEAARATIMREVQSVFGAYGIGVNSRHLSLIADFMTHQGGYRACNRMGIDSSVSPLLKMSFETAAYFLTDSSLKGSTDPLRSPAARLCLGMMTEVGTGCCQIMQSVEAMQ